MSKPTFIVVSCPQGVSKNGLPLSGSTVAPINEYHVVRITVNDNNVGPYSSYQIGRLTGLQCNLDIAEIVAFESELSDDEADKLKAIWLQVGISRSAYLVIPTRTGPPFAAPGIWE